MKLTFILVFDSYSHEIKKWSLVPSDTVAFEEAELIVKYPDDYICRLRPEELNQMKTALWLQQGMRRR